MLKRYRVLTLNNISPVGLQRLPAERYELGTAVADPEVILLRSEDMHRRGIPDSVVAVGRAGSGTNNIPVKLLSERGVPVFNTPGGNANAVKELVLTGMLMAARNLGPALDFVRGLEGDDEALDKQVEKGKKAFAGTELPGKMLGIVGLGAIGGMVADAALKLGMQVQGFDPDISVEAAWRLSSQVRRAASLEDLLKTSDYVTLHVPLVEATKNLINAKRLSVMKPSAILLNFSRHGIVDDQALAEAVRGSKLRAYVCDFPSSALRDVPNVVATPHLGASTAESEDNCAIMVAEQVRDYLEHGNIRNAVNFPQVEMLRESPFRVAVANANVPNMLGQISTAMAQSCLNIHNMTNRSRGDMAYTLVDVDSHVPTDVLEHLAQISGVLSVRYLPLET